MNKKILSMITALTVAAGAFGTAGARTIPANAGTYNNPDAEAVFSYSPTTGAVLATGISSGVTVGWQMGLVLDTFGRKIVSVASRATSILDNPRWRLVSNNSAGTLFAASSFASMPVTGGAYVSKSRAITVPLGGVLLVDARMNSGASLLRINYTP